MGQKMWSFMTRPVREGHRFFNKRIPSHGFDACWDLGWPSPLGGRGRRSVMPRKFIPFVDTPLLGPAFLLTSGIRILTILSTSCRLWACGQAFTLLFLLLEPSFDTSWDGKCEVWNLVKTKVQGMVWVSVHSRECTGTIGHKMSSVWVSTY